LKEKMDLCVQRIQDKDAAQRDNAMKLMIDEI
jgi:hypothetical protein